MEKISLYIKVICLVSILAGIMSALIPKSRLKNAYVSLSAVVLLSSMIIPVGNLNESDLQFTFINENEISESLLEEMNKAEVLIYQSIISDSLEERLLSEGLNVSVEVVSSYIDADLAVAEVIVTGNITNEERNFISDFISESFEKTEIVFKEGEND